jgi:hypothetical protein
MAIIQESLSDFDGEFFETLEGQVDHYTAEGNQAIADRLTEIGRTIAALRQNRTENL